MDRPEVRASDRTSGCRITKAESTKIGMEMTKPAPASAHSSFPLPSTRMRE